MKIGIMSDSHDNLPKIKKAVALFNKHKVGFVLHAGDFVAPFTMAVIKKLNCGWAGVFGNNDGERLGLSRLSDGRIKEGPLYLQLENRKITLVHDISKIDSQKEKAGIIIFGHSHHPEIIKRKRLLLINPGETGGWLTGKSSVAILDLENLSARIIKL